MWNGTYVNGSGSAGPGCTFGTATIDVVINLPAGVVGGTVTVIHRSGTLVLGTFNYTVTAHSFGTNSLALSAGGVPPTNGTVNVTLLFNTMTEVRSATGTQIAMDPDCTNYNFGGATRP